MEPTIQGRIRSGLGRIDSHTDVRGLLADFREEQGRPRDSIAEFKASGYLDRIVGERVGGRQASWGA